ERELLALHLLPDAVEVLGSAMHLGAQAMRSQIVGELARERLDALLALDAALVEQLGNAVVLRGLEKAEREVLELPLHLPDAEPVRERCEHLLRLDRDRPRARDL